MRIHYRVAEDGIEILRCFGADGHVDIPERIMDMPVTQAAEYAFSARKDREEEEFLVFQSGDARMFRDQERLLAGDAVESVQLPDSMKKIGRYIFYGCRNLKRLGFSDRLTNIGSGAFTGCRSLSKLEVCLLEGEKSCVPEILGDLWQRIDVSFFRKKTENGPREIRLVFPEHYEEAVENTPARILFTQHHGSGNNYRQCFYSREPDYRKYDDLFAVAKVYDKTGVLADLVFSRLMYPEKLTEGARRMYEEYLRENGAEIARYLTDTGNLKAMGEMSRRNLWERETLEKAVEHAALSEKREVLCVLMDEKHRLFPEKKNKYEL